MDRNEEILKMAGKMDRAALQKTLVGVLAGMSPETQRQIKEIAADKARLKALGEKLTPQDIASLKAHMGSTAELAAFLRSPEIRKRLGELL